MFNQDLSGPPTTEDNLMNLKIIRHVGVLPLGYHVSLTPLETPSNLSPTNPHPQTHPHQPHHSAQDTCHIPRQGKPSQICFFIGGEAKQTHGGRLF